MSTPLVAGRYEVLRPLGHGAMAVVDLARDVELHRQVALKRLAENLARDEELRARFLREARLAARLAHPNVVRVYDVGEDAGIPFIAMEHVDGETLAELVERGGPLPASEAVELGIQACAALAAAHDAGLVHRDVKPQNLLLRRDGVLKLGDFGIAVGLGGTRLTAAGTVLGTAAYLAPEQARGEEVTSAADVYGLGAVLYELLAGRPPRVPLTVLDLTATEPIPAPPGPPALARLVQRCLATGPAERPASAAELAHALSALLPEAATVRLPAPPRRRRRRPVVLAVAAIAVAAIAGGVAAALVTGGSSPPPAPRAPSVAPVARGASAQQEALNLAAWLRRYSR